MKILSLALLLMASLAFVLLGCSDNSSPVEASTDQALSAGTSPSSLAKGGILNSVTGSAHWRSVPVTGETNVKFAFTAIRHADGTVSGELVTRDKGPIMYGKARVYGLEVSGNMAKLAFQFTRGNLNTFYPAGVNITDIFGWVVVIDNGEGAKANGPDLVSLILFTDGSDISPLTIAALDPMGPEEYLSTVGDWVFVNYGITYDAFLSPFDNGSVQVR